MMRVLIATDGSTDARTAAQWLVDLPLPHQASALVLTVVDLPPSPLDIPTVADFKRTLLDEGRTAADELLPLFKGRLASVESRVVAGDPRQEIPRLAQEWAADLIVVGARGLGAVATAVLGSVSLAVARHAPCPVLVVRPSPRPLRSAAVALDGSEGALEAARFFARFPLPAGLAVRLIGVVEPPPMPRTAPSGARSMLRAAVSLITEDRRRVLEAAVDEAAKRFVSPARELPVGPPAETLERLSAEVDLIVLGARGLGPLKRLLLGSVSERVLRHAACPVLIVHPRVGV
jgi:nucleotide-binding universal stress UspA family protein